MPNKPVTLPIRTLPIVEQWDCHGCSLCCRGTTIPLDKQDLATLRDQRWDNHPDFRGVRTVTVESLLGGQKVLAKQADGSCVFLSEEGRCRIHELHGGESKPAVCRIFPFQLVPLDRFAYITSRRSCPSAAADRGQGLHEHLAQLKKSDLAARLAVVHSVPPAVSHGGRRSWPDFLSAADALARLMTDTRLPLVRRLVHGLMFCSSLDEVRIGNVKEQDWTDLMQLLEASVSEGVGDLFRDRQPPSRATASLFRQAAVHFIRSHPGFCSTGSWRERWRLVWISLKFARGNGQVPAMHSGFPAASFEDLERPLGPLPEKIANPLIRFFETHALSKQYAVVGPRRCLVDSFRALALTYPMALWLLRLAIGKREPSETDVIDIVVALERAQGMKAMSRGAAAMARTQQLERLVAWYAR